MSHKKRHSLKLGDAAPKWIDQDLDAVLAGSKQTARLSGQTIPSEPRQKGYLAVYPVVQLLGMDDMRVERSISPLLWLDVEPDVNDPQSVDVIEGSLTLNLRLLSALSGLPEADERLRGLVQKLENSSLAKPQRRWLKRKLAQLAPSVDWRALDSAPKPMSRTRLFSMSSEYALDCCFATAFYQHEMVSAHDDAILNEVEEAIQRAQESPTLQSLLHSENRAVLSKASHWRFSPSMTRQQHAILERFKHLPLTFVSGAPGTGKSFLLAAAAITLAAKGNSALIVTHSVSARDQIADFIHELGEGLIPSLRSCGGGELNLLKQQLRQHLNAPSFDEKLVIKMEQNLAQSAAAREESMRYFSACLAEHSNSDNSLLDTMRAWFSTAESKPKASLQTLLGAQTEMENRYRTDFTQYLSAAYHTASQRAVSEHRAPLSQHLKTSEFIKRQAQDMELPQAVWSCYLAVCPIWILDVASLHRILPFKPALFDSVFVDEAHLLDAALALPALYRGKRALVAVDTFSAHSAATKTQLNTNTLWHLISTSASPVLHETLSEAYRTLDHCQFENTTPKDDAAQLMHAMQTSSTRWHFTRGATWNGRYNLEESRELLLSIRHYYAASLEESRPRTIGITSPFQHQVEHLKRTAQDVLPLFAYERHKILIDSPDVFQGTERDIVICSLGIDADANIQYLRRLDQPRLLNGIFTRARHELHIFASFHPQDLVPRHLIRRIYEAQEIQSISWELPLLAQLRRKGYTVRGGSALRGLQVDFIVELDERCVGAFALGPGTPPLEMIERRLCHARQSQIPVFIFTVKDDGMAHETLVASFEEWFIAQQPLERCRFNLGNASRE